MDSPEGRTKLTLIRCSEPKKLTNTAYLHSEKKVFRPPRDSWGHDLANLFLDDKLCWPIIIELWKKRIGHTDNLIGKTTEEVFRGTGATLMQRVKILKCLKKTLGVTVE